MNAKFLEKLGNTLPPAINNNLLFHNSFAVNSRGDIIVMTDTGTLKYSNLRINSTNTVDLVDIEVFGLSNLDALEYTAIEYNIDGNMFLLWSDSCIGIVEISTNKITNDNNDSKFVYNFTKVYDRNLDHNNTAPIVKVKFHLLCQQHLVILHESNLLQLVDLCTMHMDIISLARYGSKKFTSFTFGPNIEWLKFSLLLLSTSGEVFTLCPIIPNGCVVSKAIVSDLWDGIDELNDIETKNPSINSYCNIVRSYLFETFGERPMMMVDQDSLDQRDLFIRAGEYEAFNSNDRVGNNSSKVMAKYTVYLNGPLVIEKKYLSNEPMFEDETKSIDFYKSNKGLANDICTIGNNVYGDIMQQIGAPIIAVSYSSGLVEVLVLQNLQNSIHKDAQYTVSINKSLSYIGPSWRSIDHHRPNLISSSPSLLIVESIQIDLVSNKVEDVDINNNCWYLYSDPVNNNSIHAINIKQGKSYLINCNWLEQIQEDISLIENSSKISETLVSSSNTTEELSDDCYEDPTINHPSQCIPVFIPYISNVDISNVLSNEVKQEVIGLDKEGFSGFAILYDALIGHVAIFRITTGVTCAVNLTIHTRLLELQDNMNKQKETSTTEKVAIKEELCNAVNAEQIRWRHSQECIRKVANGLRNMPVLDATTLATLTVQPSSQNKKILIETAEKLEHNVLIPLHELAQSTVFSYELVQETYKSQVDILEGKGICNNESLHTTTIPLLSIGIKKLILKLTEEHDVLVKRIKNIQEKFIIQKDKAELQLSKAINKSNKMTKAEKAYKRQLEEWSGVISKMNEQVLTLQQLSKPIPNLSPIHHQYNITSASNIVTGSAIKSPLTQTKTPVTPTSMNRYTSMYGGSSILKSGQTPYKSPPLSSINNMRSSLLMKSTMSTPLTSKSYRSNNQYTDSSIKSYSNYSNIPSSVRYHKNNSDIQESPSKIDEKSIISSPINTLYLSTDDQESCKELLQSQTILLEKTEEDLKRLEARFDILKSQHYI